MCHSREGGNPVLAQESWIPAFAGMTRRKVDYIRYADDFVVFSVDKKWLEDIIPVIAEFLREELKLELHPDKIFIKTIYSGVDFLGLVNFPDHRILRTKTRRRILKKIFANRGQLSNNLIPEEKFKQSRQSYLGFLKHCCSYKIKKKI